MAEADPSLAGEAATPLAAPAKPESASRRRTRALMLSVPLLVAAAGGYFWLSSGTSVSTDNAYVKQDVVSVSSDVAGKIVEVNVAENQLVKAGDPLFRVDPASFRVALDQANASIATAQVEVEKLRTDYSTTSVDIEGARQDVAFARQDLERQQALMDRGFTTRARLQQSQHELDSAETRLANAQADAAKARSALATGAQIPGVNPRIAAAMAQRERAELDLSRTLVRAPVSGRISQTSKLQLGQQMITGLPALSIVADNRSWVEANFKETQLAKMRPGQPATLTFDAYPGLKLRGHVASIGAGTGSQFSVLPAQNANGNWVKVTQRIPVRIAIDDKSPRQLIAGQSTSVTVDVEDHGKR